jgi:hypothetical protein
MFIYQRHGRRSEPCILKRCQQYLTDAHFTVSIQRFSILHFTHVFRDRHWSSHGDMYIQKCRELEIAPDPRALPKSETEKPEGLSKQASLDSFIEATPNVKWSRQGLLEHLMDFVVSDDQVS